MRIQQVAIIWMTVICIISVKELLSFWEKKTYRSSIRETLIGLLQNITEFFINNKILPQRNFFPNEKLQYKGTAEFFYGKNISQGSKMLSIENKVFLDYESFLREIFCP